MFSEKAAADGGTFAPQLPSSETVNPNAIPPGKGLGRESKSRHGGIATNCTGPLLTPTKLRNTVTRLPMLSAVTTSGHPSPLKSPTATPLVPPVVVGSVLFQPKSP